MVQPAFLLLNSTEYSPLVSVHLQKMYVKFIHSQNQKIYVSPQVNEIYWMRKLGIEQFYCAKYVFYIPNLAFFDGSHESITMDTP